jgi:predicted nucleic acid-binding protein
LAKRFIKELTGFRRVAVDTSCCIYYIDPRDEHRHELASAVFARAARSEMHVAMPAIVHLELLVRPLMSGDHVQMLRVRRLSEGQRGVGLEAMSMDVVRLSAEVRAATGLKAPDALVAGSAITAGCEAIIGNDARFRRLNGTTELPATLLPRATVTLPRYIHIDDFLEDA